MKISWEQADVITKFPQISLVLFLSISRLGVNMLVKGSLLIRGFKWVYKSQSNSVQFYTANTVCLPHDHSALGLCHYLLNIQPLSLWWGGKSELLLPAWLTGSSLCGGSIILCTYTQDLFSVALFVARLHKSQGLLDKTFQEIIRWDGMIGVNSFLRVSLCAHCTYYRDGWMAESTIRMAHFDRQPLWAQWPPLMTAGQKQKRTTALGACGFAYKMLLWPDLAFMGNPLNSDPFKLKWTFLAGAGALRSQIICMV